MRILTPFPMGGRGMASQRTAAVPIDAQWCTRLAVRDWTNFGMRWMGMLWHHNGQIRTAAVHIDAQDWPSLTVQIMTCIGMPWLAYHGLSLALATRELIQVVPDRRLQEALLPPPSLPRILGHPRTGRREPRMQLHPQWKRVAIYWTSAQTVCLTTNDHNASNGFKAETRSCEAASCCCIQCAEHLRTTFTSSPLFFIHGPPWCPLSSVEIVDVLRGVVMCGILRVMRGMSGFVGKCWERGRPFWLWSLVLHVRKHVHQCGFRRAKQWGIDKSCEKVFKRIQDGSMPGWWEYMNISQHLPIKRI